MDYSKNEEILINQALIPLYEKLKKNDIVNDTVEIISAHIEFDMEDEDGFLNLGSHRKAPVKYADNERKWYLSMDCNIKGHPGIEDNPIWSKVCSDDGFVNSNYGWMILSPENGNGKLSQFDYALNQLCTKPEGRQSVMYYGRPSMQWEWNDNVHAKSNFTCTFSTQHFVRNDKLIYIVNMRSNDVLFGLQAGDFPWHVYVYNHLINRLNKYNDLNSRVRVERGTLFWNAGSLHVYSKHFDLLKRIVEEYKEEQSTKHLF